MTDFVDRRPEQAIRDCLKGEAGIGNLSKKRGFASGSRIPPQKKVSTEDAET